MLHHFSVLDSTSSRAFELAKQGAAHGTVVQADRQTGGRGRAGRRFSSPPGGLYCSIILRPKLEATDFPLLTLFAGLALALAVKKTTGVHVQLKWPNDVYLADKKLGGILTESGPLQGVLPAFVVLGVGINVTSQPEDFPPELRSKVISLAALDVQSSPNDLLPSLVGSLQDIVERFEHGAKQALLAEWRTVDYLLGRPLQYQSGEEIIPATGAGLAEDGCYSIVDHFGKEHRVLVGDLHPIKITN
jgi:BirA family biotin operon repressor/biotin-[acetyl-CoA-carboxylase] ligase